MPAKKQISREKILQTALQLLMQDGFEAVNVKQLAAALHCSTQPIYLSFDSMDALRAALVPAAVQEFVSWMQAECEHRQVHLYDMAYLRFAKQQPELFRFLFMREKAFVEMKQALQPILDNSIAELMEQQNLSREQADELHDQLWMHAHGIAAMIATDYCDWNMEKAERMLNACQEALKKYYEA